MRSLIVGLCVLGGCASTERKLEPDHEELPLIDAEPSSPPRSDVVWTWRDEPAEAASLPRRARCGQTTWTVTPSVEQLTYEILAAGTDDGRERLRVRPRLPASSGHHQLQIGCRGNLGMVVFGRYASTAIAADENLYVDEIDNDGNIVATTTHAAQYADVELDLREAEVDRQELRSGAFQITRDRDDIEIQGNFDEVVASFRADQPTASIALFQGLLAVSTVGPEGAEVSLHRLNDGARLARRVF